MVTKAEAAAEADKVATGDTSGSTDTVAQGNATGGGLYTTSITADDDVSYGKAEASPIQVAVTPGSAEGELDPAQKAAVQDARLRRDNANQIVYREADPAVGGTSFSYGGPAPTTDSESGSKSK